jgi:DNA-directed RNA polymerase subunit N (RpoN/RPB10)
MNQLKTARDQQADKAERCPTCGHPLGTRNPRSCYDCGKVIGRGHKFIHVTRTIGNNSFTTVVHRNCKKVESYHK